MAQPAQDRRGPWHPIEHLGQLRPLDLVRASQRLEDLTHRRHAAITSYDSAEVSGWFITLRRLLDIKDGQNGPPELRQENASWWKRLRRHRREE